MSAGVPATGQDPQRPTPLRVLFVCTANLCRSPMAEYLLRHAVAEAGLDWQVSSAGTRAVTGRSAHPNTLSVLAERGVPTPPPGTWSSRQLTAELARDADLILVAAAEHRRAVVGTLPAALQRTFLLLDFARLCAAADSVARPAPSGTDPGRALLPAAQLARAQLQAVPVAELEVADPIGHPVPFYRTTAASVAEATATIVTAAGRLSAAG